jgi:hypothetical protein
MTTTYLPAPPNDSPWPPLPEPERPVVSTDPWASVWMTAEDARVWR